jgi:hypothetical protein
VVEIGVAGELLFGRGEALGLAGITHRSLTDLLARRIAFPAGKEGKEVTGRA